MTRHGFEELAVGIGNKVTIGGGVTAGGSGLVGQVAQHAASDPQVVEQVISMADIGAAVGITFCVMGYLTSLYFQWRRDQREERAHRAMDHAREMFSVQQDDGK